MSWATFREYYDLPPGTRMPAHACPECGKKRVLIARSLISVACRECITSKPGVPKRGDLVRFTGTGRSVLDHGPGEFLRVEGNMGRVRVTVGGEVCHNTIRAGETYLFSLKNLEVVR